MTQKIVGAFRTEQEATRAIEELKQQGFRADEISVIAKDRGESSHIQDETGTKAPEGLASGAATGGVLGGVTGTTTNGTTNGGLLGGLLGGLSAKK